MTTINEAQILHRVVEALRGVTDQHIELCYEDDTDVALRIYPDTQTVDYEDEAFACDSCTLRVLLNSGSKKLPDGDTVTHYRHAWVYLVWGNGLDCIADCTVSLEEALKPVMQWIEEQESEQ